MSLNNARPGLNYVPEYQVSGLPWAVSGSVTTTPIVHEFPTVSSAITVVNNSANTTFLKVGFTQNGVNGSSSFNLMGGGSPQRFECRARDLWLRAEAGTVNYSVFAELTTIERLHMPILTDSSVTGSLAWQGVG